MHYCHIAAALTRCNHHKELCCVSVLSLSLSFHVSFFSEIEFISAKSYGFISTECVFCGNQRAELGKKGTDFPPIHIKSCKFHWHLFFFACLFAQEPSPYMLAFNGKCNHFRLHWYTELVLNIWKCAKYYINKKAGLFWLPCIQTLW